LVTAVAVVFAIAIWGRLMPKTNDVARPSLSETLEWMDNTYNSHEGQGGAFGHGTREYFVDSNLWRGETVSFAYHDCTLTLRVQGNPIAKETEDRDSVTTETFNLGDIDPDSIKDFQTDSSRDGMACSISPMMNCDSETIDFETRNQAPLINRFHHIVYWKATGTDHIRQWHDKSFLSSFPLDNIQYGKRFEAAFRHAVDLCGGKKSTY
jgi:hypothetical protein